ncbi:MAG: NAD-dependent deacylase [Deltaproteobacteria bacterium]|nr:NAD-dependent deacylase [Deltaproteobacteria bacterium]
MKNDDIEEVRKRLGEARSVAVLTGAGVSAESGVPTFRGDGGLWRNYRAEELATPQAFARDPSLVWEWYSMRRELLADIRPNPAHIALATLEEKVVDFTLITQNVDGLHAMGGSRNIVELHGNIWRVRCTGCGVVKENRDVPIAIPPSCSKCGAILRPHIVWFGESLPGDAITTAYGALERCDLLLVIGTSGVVQPAASMASMARGAGGYVVEVNIESTPNTAVVDKTIEGKATEVVPLIVG